jgi:N-hydroxyarylamine O-acetyltransferase
VDVPAYLRRIRYQGPTAPTAECLRRVHRAHMMAVPFENLDIGLKRPILLDEERFFDKIITRGRGGFCYELNGLFGALLRELGFKVTLLSARVYGEGNREGREFDHLTLRVDLDQPWLADVGFGDSFLEPLRLSDGFEQEQQGVTYRLQDEGQRWKFLKRDAGAWKPLYDFTLIPRRLDEFTAACHYTQTSPDSWFTQRRVCSRPTADGRITLTDLRLITTSNGERRERELKSEEDFRAALREHFGIALE